MKYLAIFSCKDFIKELRISIYRNCLFFFILILSYNAYSQDIPTICNEIDPVFAGDTESTLCDIYGDLSNPLQIGQGTLITTASQFVGSSYTGNVWIRGDFIVDKNFTFLNCLIKIDEDVEIQVVSPNSPLQYNRFTVDNSKLFSCEGIWKGIDLSNRTIMITKSSTKIEDAEAAIHAIDKQYCGLFIESTNFNRNIVGILLSQTSQVIKPANIYRFNHNSFTCTAPINGTSDDIGLAGIKLVNAQALTLMPISDSYANTFESLKYGIIAEGSPISIKGRFMHFKKIREAGIYMAGGLIDLTASRFYNCDKIGLDILEAHLVKLNGCRFDYSEGLSDPGANFNERDGMHIKSFGFNSYISIFGCSFNANLTSAYKNVRGLHFEGGTVGSGTQITISSNTWDYYANNSKGIYIPGIFPSNCYIDIIGNTFEIESPQPGFSSYGISCISGDKSNFSIIGNTFTNADDLPYQTGIQLIGSTGTENEISGNHIPYTTFFRSWLPGVEVQTFDNTKFCSNDFYSSNRAFTFAGLNDDIIFVANEVYGHQLIFVSDKSWLGDQNHAGNKWNLLDLGSGLGIYQVLPQAELEDVNNDDNYEVYSNFEVHTLQSTNYSGPNFNEYHPVWISPDNNNEWWSQTIGNPASNCLNQSPPGFATDLRKKIADEVIDTLIADSNIIWQAKKQLFTKLYNNQDSISLYSGFSAFYSNNSNNPIGLECMVSYSIDSLLIGDTSRFVMFRAYREEIDSLLKSLLTIDSILELSSSSMQLDTNMVKKSETIDLILELIADMDSINSEYYSEISAGVDDIRSVNDRISPRNDLELDENIFYDMYLRYLENRELSDEESDSLMVIANKCPKDAGRVVYLSRGLLPYCLTREISDDNEECYPRPGYELDTTHVNYSRSALINSTINIGDNAIFKLYPNPTSNILKLDGIKDKIKKIEIWDNLGNMVISLRDFEFNETINVDKLVNGLYYIRVTTDNELFQSEKFLILR